MKNQIIIQDWTGNILFDGDYRDEQVDTVLDANKCPCRFHDEIIHEIEICSDCDDTGYIGDINVQWLDETNTDNVYEFINY
jgi:hypothetical protein